MRHIQFDPHGQGWTHTDINSFASSVLLQYAHRFATSNTDLSFCTTVPFEIDVPPCTQPTAFRPYRTNPAISALVNAILYLYLAAGFTQKAESPWSSLLVALPKKDGSICISVNYQRLHDVSIIGKIPIQRIDEILDCLGEGKVLPSI